MTDEAGKVVGVDGFYGIPYEGAQTQWIPYGEWIQNPGGSSYRIEKPSRRPRRPQVSAIPPTPPDPLPKQQEQTNAAVKQASPDIIIFDEEIDPDFLVQAFFEEFGGTELINISRYDLINGQDVVYSPIVNLSNLRQAFNPNNIIEIGAFQESPTRYGIDLFSRGVVDPYFDNDGNLVIELDEVRPDESIEVEIVSNGTIKRIDL
jgi:hypothetical protein